MKKTSGKEVPVSKERKKKTTLCIFILIIVLVAVPGILFILHASGSYAIDADEINDSLAANDMQATENNLQETELPELSSDVDLDVTQAAEPIPTTAQEPSKESEPEPTIESIPQPETAPESDPEVPTEHMHIYEDSVIAPTCNSKGYTLHECDCGHNYTDNAQEMLPHTYTELIISPTTEFQGYTLHSCSVCGYQYKDNYTDPVATPTDPPIEETQPTVTDPKTEDEQPEEDYGFCPVCGRRLWTSWYPSGCFTYLEDTVCSCGQLVHAIQCHHH